jgi:hypothetical protein
LWHRQARKAAEGRRSLKPGGNSERLDEREASWNAPALWRFGTRQLLISGRPGGTWIALSLALGGSTRGYFRSALVVVFRAFASSKEQVRYRKEKFWPQLRELQTSVHIDGIANILSILTVFPNCSAASSHPYNRVACLPQRNEV